MPTGTITLGGITFNPSDFKGISTGEAVKLSVQNTLKTVIPVVGGIIAAIVGVIGIRGKTKHPSSEQSEEIARALSKTTIDYYRQNSYPFRAVVNGRFPYQIFADRALALIAREPTREKREDAITGLTAMSARTVPDNGEQLAWCFVIMGGFVIRNQDAERLETEVPKFWNGMLADLLQPVNQAIDLATSQGKKLEEVKDIIPKGFDLAGGKLILLLALVGAVLFALFKRKAV